MLRFDRPQWLSLMALAMLGLLPPPLAQAQDVHDFDFFEWAVAEEFDPPSDLIEALGADGSAQLVANRLAPGEAAYILTPAEVRAVAIGADASVGGARLALPENVTQAGAAMHQGRLYLAASAPDPGLWVLDPADPGAGWRAVDALPGPISSDVRLTSASGRLFATSQAGSYALDIAAQDSTVRTPAPAALSDYTSTAIGSAHIVFFDRTQPQVRFLAYHIITDQWFYAELDRDPIQVLSAATEPNGFRVLTPDGVEQVRLTQPQHGIGPLDYVIVVALFAAVFLIGIRFARSSKSTHDYFRSSRAIPWWAAALSIFATSASAITVMAMPAMSFAGDWTYLTIAIYLVIIQVPLYTFLYVPIIRRLNFPSANQYLENRFGFSVRILGFLGFSLNQLLGRAAAILLLPAVAINAIFGLPIIHCILIMGICTTIFVAMGGFEAVVWTDVLLALIMVSAIISSLAFALIGIDTTVDEARSVIQRLDKVSMFDFRIDLSAPVVLVLFLNSLVTSLGYIGDQNFVQRVQSTKTQKGAKLAAVSQLGVAVPLNFVLFSLGTVLFLYYANAPQVISPAMPPDGIYPFFAATALPPGVAGLVVIALLAATISTVSSALSSVSNVMVEDLYKRLNTRATDAGSLRLGRWLTVGLGLFATGTALILASLSGLQSIWDLFLTVTGLIVGPVTGTFVLGIFSRRANAFGIWSGTLASVAANLIAKTYFDLHSTVFLTVGVFTCVIVGYLASWLRPAPTQSLAGLTIGAGKLQGPQTSGD